jgi:hypothetical protein
MKESTLRMSGLMICTLFVGSCAPIGNVESKFVLAPDSRLPSWARIPGDLKRSDIVVVLKYLTPSDRLDDATVEIRDRGGRKLASAHGQVCWHPATLRQKNRFGGLDPDVYPRYHYVRINGTTEVIEHRRMEPVFRISDDAELRRTALSAERCEKG